MSKHITTEDFTLPLEFLTKSGDGQEIRTKVEVVAHLEDAKAFKQKFILEPSKFDTSQLAVHLSELDELKELVNAECAAYNAEYLCSDPMVSKQIAEKLKEPLSEILKERGLKFVQIERLIPARLKPIPRQPANTLSGTARSATGQGQKIWHMPFIVTAVILLAVVVGFICYYVQTSATVSNLHSQLSGSQTSNLTAQVSSLQSQLSSANAQVSSLQKENSSYQSQVASLQNQLSGGSQSNLQTQITQLQSQLSSANSQVSSLQSQLSSANSQVSSLQNDVSTYKSQASSLQSQLSSANSQVSSLQSQLSSANSQVSSLQNIINLSQSSTEANQVTINQSSGQSSSVATFTASYAGYVVVSGTSTTSNGYLMVTDSAGGYPYNNTNYAFGTGATRTIPVLPGTVTVYFANSNLMNGATATITVTYYY